jgi:flagellar export protein FliJ
MFAAYRQMGGASFKASFFKRLATDARKMNLYRRAGSPAPALFQAFAYGRVRARELVVDMKSRETLVRLKRFQADEKRRRVKQLEMMIAEFARMAGELDKEIAAEEQRARISDPSHFAYPTYARAARVRRDNILSSADELKGQVEDAKAALEEAQAELAKAEQLDGREKGAEKMIEVMRAPDGAAMAGLRVARA